MIFALILLAVTLGCIWVSFICYATDREIFVILSGVIGFICFMWFILPFNPSYISKSGLDCHKSQIEYKINLVKSLEVDDSYGSPFSKEKVELINLLESYNYKIGLIGNNNPYKDNIFYVHYSQNIDEKEYIKYDIKKVINKEIYNKGR